MPSENEKKGVIFSLERYAIYDGPGIRSIVFLKGCPLNCLWCQNPEGKETRPQLMFFSDKCTGCARCASVCPNEAVNMVEGKSSVNRDKCQQCFKCVEVCPNEARQITGRIVGCEEIMAEVMKDKAFYRRSGGGITLSGGDPLMQPDFAAEILRQCKEKDIHTTVETSGFADYNDFINVLKYTDFLYCDIKHMNSKEHKAGVGVGNEIILDNLKKISRNVTLNDMSLVVRVPVVPGYNDSKRNIFDTVAFARELKKVHKIELLPYNKLGVLKYERLGKKYMLPDIDIPAQESLNELKEMVEACNIECEVL
ncbi:glycyl-radical enzyme activating protein [Chloroflexota bacterium]